MPRRTRPKEVPEEISHYSGYTPPLIRKDTIDELVNKVDQEGTDKYRTSLAEVKNSDVLSVSSLGSPSESSTNNETSSRASAVPELSHSESKAARLLEEQMLWAEDDFYRVKQSFGYISIALTAFQLFVLIMQLTLCGIAPLDVNHMVGPYPDTFSEWGGKNAYLVVVKLELYRLITPALLHVGVLHLLLNAYVQLDTCAFFEREWGSCKWLWLYVLSEVGCILVSCVANPDTIAVGSSGALMGLFGAKIAHVATHTFFEVVSSAGDSIHLEQLSGVLCSLAMILSVSFFTYIDWSGHMGGLGVGFFAGMLAFSTPIRNPFSRFLWRMWGSTGLFGGLGTAAYVLWTQITPDADLANACDYFRNLYFEGYDCKCLF